MMTITPSGRRTPASWLRLIGFATGAVVGGAVAFGSVGALGVAVDFSEPLATAMIVIVALWIAVWHGTRHTFPPLPFRNGQVPRRWSRSLPGVVSFGAMMGLGVATKVSSGLVHFALLLALLCGDGPTALTAGAVFGLARSSPVLLAFTIAPYPKDPTSYMRMLTRHYPPGRRLVINLVLLLLTALTASLFI